MTPSESMRQFAADHSAMPDRLVNGRAPRLSMSGRAEDASRSLPAPSARPAHPDDDPLAAARGIVYAVIIMASVYALIALAWWAL